MGIKKVNTTVYHPQTDGLVERFNCTLTDMLTMTTDKGGRDLDVCLLYMLFAIQDSMQSSTMKSLSSYCMNATPGFPQRLHLQY